MNARIKRLPDAAVLLAMYENQQCLEWGEDGYAERIKSARESVEEAVKALESRTVIDAADIERLASWGAAMLGSQLTRSWSAEDYELLGRIEQAAEQESVDDDSDLIDEDPLPSADAGKGFWQWRSYADGTFDAKAPGAIAWMERLRSPRDVWAVLHGWVDLAKTTEGNSKSNG